VRKLGANLEEAVDVRIISATHQSLASCVEAGKFRQDLFYRLSVIELGLPALRERLDDLEVLIETILQRLSSTGSKVLLGVGVLDTLRSYAFPGNVRELENILERALAFADDGVIEVANLALKGAHKVLPADTAAADNSMAAASALPHCLPDYLNQVERDIILRALAQTRFNRTQAAQLLGISLRQLRYQMQRLAIHAPEP
jgi:two-component system response regulator PilR (NtrC family)